MNTINSQNSPLVGYNYEEALIEMDRIAKMLVRRDLVLTELKEQREKELEELKQKTKELEKTKETLEETTIVLEIRVKARTRQLQELVAEQEDIIQERTKKLQKSQEALFQTLAEVETAKQKTEEEQIKTLAIITNFVDGILVFDNKEKIILANPQAERFFGTTKKNLDGKALRDLLLYPKFQPLVNAILDRTEEFCRKEFKIEETFILEVTTLPLIGLKKKIILVILHDITREKTIEKLKTEFVSIAAHQLRTPLSAIKWGLKMFVNGDFGVINDNQKDILEKTYSSNERMIHLVNDLLDLSRIEEGRFLFHLEKTSLEDIISSAIDSYQTEIQKRRLQFEFKRPAKKSPLVTVDVEKIKLVILNLMDNSIKYTPSGGQVVISLDNRDSEVLIQVQDSGVGIPEDQKSRIFSKFFRGTNVTKMETEGTGLGLFIVKNIIEAHGGKIWFESKEHKGTTVSFTLPIKI